MRLAWLGPASLVLSCVSWLLPVVGAALAVPAMICGLLSMFVRAEFRIDWTATVGTTVAAGQLLLSVVLFLA
ncbi:hypothetical protein HX744_26550 [Pseudonocardia sp. ICBG1122]|nr:hypothetical protein [Pseudonocardia pini]